MPFDVARQLAAAPCVFLDCDGVIFDSNAFKLAGLDAVLAEFPAASHEPMRAYWSRSGGLSRYVKFDHLARQVLGLSGVEAERAAARAVEIFARHSRAGYVDMAPLPQALRFARALGPQRLVVISGTDQDELVGVFRDKALGALFPVVLGSPTKKPEHLRAQLALRGVHPASCLFVGDGAADLAAATELGMPFVFLAAHSGWHGADAAVAEASARGPVARAESWAELLTLAGA